jgi:hypothetical protein
LQIQGGYKKERGFPKKEREKKTCYGKYQNEIEKNVYRVRHAIFGHCKYNVMYK